MNGFNQVRIHGIDQQRSSWSHECWCGGFVPCGKNLQSGTICYGRNQWKLVSKMFMFLSLSFSLLSHSSFHSYQFKLWLLTHSSIDLYKYRAGVLIPKSSRVENLNDLRGLRSCHTGVGRTAGWHIPIGHLLSNGIMIPDCVSELSTVAKFFDRSCAPGSWSSDPIIDRQLSEFFSAFSLFFLSFSLLSSFLSLFLSSYLSHFFQLFLRFFLNFVAWKISDSERFSPQRPPGWIDETYFKKIKYL